MNKFDFLENSLESARRPNHSGIIFMQCGLWYGRVLICRKMKLFSGYGSRKKTEIAMNRYLVQMEKRIDFKITFAEWAYEWLNAIHDKKSPNTYRNYRTSIAHACRKIGNKRLTDITCNDLTRLYSKLMSEGLRASTVLLVASAIRPMVKYALASRKIISDFTIRSIRPKKIRRKYRIFTQGEALEFIGIVDNERLKFPLLFVLLFGLRRGEAMGIKWNDINFEKETIFVKEQSIIENGARVTRPPKTESSIRELAIPDILLRKLLDVPNSKKKTYPYDFLKVNPNSLSRDFKRITRAMGITDMRLHDLRHNYASIVIHFGVPHKEVADQLGHSSDRIVNNVYTHKLPDHEGKCAKIINDFFKCRTSQVLLRVATGKSQRATVFFCV